MTYSINQPNQITLSCFLALIFRPAFSIQGYLQVVDQQGIVSFTFESQVRMVSFVNFTRAPSLIVECCLGDLYIVGFFDEGAIGCELAGI